MLSKFINSTLIVLSGTLLGQIVVLAASPLLTRLYSPKQFGEFSIFAVTLYVFMAISAGRYDAAILAAESTKDANRLSRYSIIFSSFTSILVLLFLTAYLAYDYDQNVDSIQFLLPISILFAGINTTLVNNQLRRQKQISIAASKAVQALASTSMQAFLGFCLLGAPGLIVGQAFGLLASLLFLKSKKLLTVINPTHTKKSDTYVLHRYIKFPKYEVASALTSVANNHLPTLIIGLLSTATNTGAYALAQRVITTPLNLVAGSISSSILAFGRTKQRTNDIIIFSTIDSVGNTISSIVVLVGFFLMYFFGWLFGELWSSAGVIAGWLCLTAGSKFKTDSSFAYTTVNNRQSEGLAIQISLIIFKVAPLLVLLPLLEFNNVIAVFSLSSSVSYHYAAKKIAPVFAKYDSLSTFKHWGSFFVAFALMLATANNHHPAIAVLFPLQIAITLAYLLTTLKLFKSSK